MAIIKYSSRRGIVSVFEDPRAGNNTIYLEGEAYVKSTLSPIFNGSIYLDRTGDKTFGAGENVYNNTSGGAVDRSGGSAPGTMSLNKEVAVCSQFSGSVTYLNSIYTAVNIYHFLSMDPADPMLGIRRVTNSTNEDLYVWIHVSGYTTSETYIATWLSPQRDFYLEPPSTTIVNSYNAGSALGQYQAVTIEEGTWVSVLMNRQDAASTLLQKPQFCLARNKFREFNSTNAAANIGIRNRNVAQYIGKSSVNGRPIYIFNSVDNDYSQFIDRHNVSLNTVTTLHTFNTTSGGGTNAGGARAATSIGLCVKLASKTFPDPNTSGTICFYLPFFDSANNYHPYLYRWNQSTDVFTRTSSITVNGNKSSSYFGGYVGIGTTNLNSGLSAVIINETFISNGTRYITMFPLHGQFQLHDTVPGARTCVTYSIDSGDPTNLTHHSAVVLPETPRNLVFLRDDRLCVAFIFYSHIGIYNWSDVSGWVETGVIPGTFTSIGRDSLDRVWATQTNGHERYVDIKILTPTIPLKITVIPASATYNYTGTNINSSVDVSAYDINGSRMAISVKLTIDGSSMTFDDSTTVKTVTTSSSAELSVPVIITSAGITDISAMINL